MIALVLSIYPVKKLKSFAIVECCSHNDKKFKSNSEINGKEIVLELTDNPVARANVLRDKQHTDEKRFAQMESTRHDYSTMQL